MKKIELKLSLDVILAIVFFIVLVIEFLNGFVRGAVFLWPLFLLWSISVRLYEKHLVSILTINRKLYVSLVVFIIVMFLNYCFNYTSEKGLQYIFIFINMVLILIMESYYSIINNIYKKFTIVFYIILSLGIQAWISIPYILKNNFLMIRHMSNGELGKAQIQDAINHGVGTNALYTSLVGVFFYGAVVFSYYKSKFVRFLLLVSLIGILLSILISTLNTPIFLVVIFGLLLVFMNFRKLVNLKAILLVGLSLIIGVFLVQDLMTETDLFRPVVQKVERLMNSNESVVSNREDLANVSINTFLENPFFGIGVPEWRSYDLIGEHMPWVDFLGNFGVIGILPLFAFFVFLTKRAYQKRKENGLYGMICFVCFLIIIVSNFVSPMLTTPITYSFLIFVFTSNTSVINLKSN